MRKILFLIVIAILVISPDADAQRRKSAVSKKFKRSSKKISSFSGSKTSPYFSLGVSLNTLNYYGDITPRESFASSDISFTRPGIGALGSYTFGGRYNIEASFQYGRLQADDKSSQDLTGETSRYRYVRNLHFRNDIKEFSLVGTFDIFENYGSYVNRFVLVPYISAGITVFHHNPQAIAPEGYALEPGVSAAERPFEESGQWIDLRPLGTEGQWLPDELRATYSEVYNRELPRPYSLWQIAIPVAIGARYRLTNNLDLSFQISYRQLFTDYIDDVSSAYVDLTVFDYYENGVNPDLARAMSYRSNEEVSAYSGEERTVLPEGTFMFPLGDPRYPGFNGDPYNYLVLRGYGNDFRPPEEINARGSANDNDVYLVTSFRLTYILSGSFRNARFR